MIRKTASKFIFIIAVILLVTGCKRSPFDVRVSDIHPNIKIHRFEKDLFNIKLDQPKISVDSMNQVYSHFLSLFGYVIHIGQSNDPRFPEFLVQFVTDRVNNEVFQKVQDVFPQTSILERKFKSAFQHYLYYFPEKSVPEIFTFVSGFNTSLIIDTNLMGIGLDRYLGVDYPYYMKLGIPHYMTQKMTPERIFSDAMFAWGKTEFAFLNNPGKEPTDNVLNHILYEGKLIYFVKSMLPDEEIGLILGFTKNQMEWCKENELDMWTFLIEHKLLFNTESITIRKLTGEAPFTSLFPRKSPGRASVWLGFRIVSSYMGQHKELPLKELMKESDYQKIMNEAKYDPK